MKNEIESLRQTFSDAKIRIRELEEDANIFRKDLEKADDDRLKLDAALKEANEEIDSKAAEIVASLNTANRLQVCFYFCRHSGKAGTWEGRL